MKKGIRRVLYLVLAAAMMISMLSACGPKKPAPEDAQNHKVEEVPDGSGRLLNKEELTEAYVKMFSRYAENGDTVWSSD